jgi:hypothetical protein
MLWEPQFSILILSTAFKQAYKKCTLNLKPQISGVLTGFQYTT